jgi:hypothetical protein
MYPVQYEAVRLKLSQSYLSGGYVLIFPWCWAGAPLIGLCVHRVVVQFQDWLQVYCLTCFQPKKRGPMIPENEYN